MIVDFCGPGSQCLVSDLPQGAPFRLGLSRVFMRTASIDALNLKSDDVLCVNLVTGAFRIFPATSMVTRVDARLSISQYQAPECEVQR